MPRNVMIFAAGFGTRMRELTKTTPKPLLEVDGTTLLDHAINAADRAGLQKKIVNVSYLGQQIVAHLKHRRDILISEEGDHALETGGGLKKALPLLGENPVFTMNPDAIWTGANPFAELLAAWDPERMDGLLLLQPLETAISHAGKGDFTLAPDGHLNLKRFAGEGRAFVNTGVEIIRTDLVSAQDAEAFSLNLVWDQMLRSRRLFGVVHNGGWVDVGTPEGITAANDHLNGQVDV